MRFLETEDVVERLTMQAVASRIFDLRAEANKQ